MNPLPPTHAVIVGINYRKNLFLPTLDTAASDAHRVYRHVVRRYRTPKANIRFLSDTPSKDFSHPVEQATQRRLRSALKWLASHSNASLFLYFAGHGVQQGQSVSDWCGGGVKDCSEVDGRSEKIIPSNATRSFRTLLDKELFALLVQALPPTSTLYAVFDCCNSATLLQLPLVYVPLTRTWAKNTKCPTENNASVVCLSASQDDQFAYENVDGKSGGAFTTQWLKYDRKYHKNPIKQLHEISDQLGNLQTPTLTATKRQ